VVRELREFIPYESIDYVHVINTALREVFRARARVFSLNDLWRYIRALEALYAILTPKLKDRRVKELIDSVKSRFDEYALFFSREDLEDLDKALELIISILDRNRLLIKGEVYEVEDLSD